MGLCEHYQRAGTDQRQLHPQSLMPTIEPPPVWRLSASGFPGLFFSAGNRSLSGALQRTGRRRWHGYVAVGTVALLLARLRSCSSFGAAVRPDLATETDLAAETRAWAFQDFGFYVLCCVQIFLEAQKINLKCQF